MAEAFQLGFEAFSKPPKGVLILLCEEGLKLGPASRRLLAPAGDLLRRAAAADRFTGKSGSALDIVAPGPLAAVLHATASYLFEAGDVIADGDTISGPEGDEHWRCRHEDALVGPRRQVLDVDPGEPYAAGRRERG